MRIVVDIRPLFDIYTENTGYLQRQLLKHLALQQPDHTFIVITDNPSEAVVFANKNVSAVVAGKSYRFFRKYWYERKLRSVLKEYKADMFISFNGVCLLSADLPQTLLLHQLSFQHRARTIKKSALLFYQQNTGKWVKKATSILTTSELLKEEIITQYNAAPQKIKVIYPAAREGFAVVSEHGKEQIRSKYTAEKNFFVYTGAIDQQEDWMKLLKAFSVFKKRQKTDWKLVCCGKIVDAYTGFARSFGSYKYREDVVLAGHLGEKETLALFNAAYAMIDPADPIVFNISVLDAMEVNVPVIACRSAITEELVGDAVLYAEPGNHSDLADKMMLLYKDETLRQQLVEKGRFAGKKYGWDKTASLVWEHIQAVDSGAL